MKFEVSIDPSYKEPKIIILTDKMTDEISDIMKRLSETHMDSLAVFSERGVEIVECKDIIRIYTEKQKVFLQTAAGIYPVRSRLYELEEKLNSQFFVRISNSEIVNIKMITNMDISMTGTIGVSLTGNIKTYASRRYVSKIKKLFGI
ncbi:MULTISPECIES: LytTR family DNA-binding domain-containing protein [Bacillus]|uniref:LytTR family DNA-binding domain-containing protein n=1 Tax=Bacillus TaxID=1386 RepID=UPI000BED1EAD|nr:MULTISPECIES: LytTR family DNA-binding domain-containing protein [Bacillus cereus group]PED05976.1 LytTR family transcriptional regulator [Bacillus pseudomycoides]PEI94288.1 LytTR family transcriptional regulator [Bacillus pseudomycoides]PEI98352.1 LytTR family transcriptional regulator [Bacillus pseudomycoides]PEK16228.1 LytTR family transcriptional regulator [Bacillus pseudomycoides]PEM76282.1 LytTR family transcriptional regulator [Bacillus pseudomycoides]